jgi:hypothetical protein
MRKKACEHYRTVKGKKVLVNKGVKKYRPKTKLATSNYDHEAEQGTISEYEAALLRNGR